MGSNAQEVQALALGAIVKLVAAAGAERTRPHLPTLVPALLEGLSGLEVCLEPGRELMAKCSPTAALKSEPPHYICQCWLAVYCPSSS